MSTAYTDGNGNVTSSIAADVASFVYAMRAAAAVPQAAPHAEATGTALAADSVTSLTVTCVNLPCRTRAARTFGPA